MSPWYFHGGFNLGPSLYVEHGGFMLHFWARWFRDPWHHGFGAGLTLRVADRYRVFRRWGIG